MIRNNFNFVKHKKLITITFQGKISVICNKNGIGCNFLNKTIKPEVLNTTGLRKYPVIFMEELKKKNETRVLTEI